MKIADLRRDRLRAWYESRSIPEREKSYISQLLSGKASFGEKAARRLESDYGMPNLYLDTVSTYSVKQIRGEYTKNNQQAISAEEEAILLAYRGLDRPEQLMVLKLLDIKTPDFAQSA